MSQNIYTKPLTKELWHDFESYFEFEGQCSGCWCMNHRLPIGLNFEGEAAKLAMKQLIQSNRVFGVLAYVKDDPIPVGWAALDRRKTLPGHDCIGEDIDCHKHEWAIHCLTSRKDFKDRGVEAVLANAATHLAIELGAQRIEGYPEPNSSESKAFSTWNTFSGHQKTFEALGYRSLKTVDEAHSEFFECMEKKV